MTIINLKLAITPEQYESMIWNLYSNWCINVTTTEKEFQQVIANSSVNNWFRMELTNCEAEFVSMAKSYSNQNVTTAAYEKCYRECTLNLFNIRPTALLAKIVKRKAKGTRVFNTLSQN